jgi:hypothetical protein
MDSLALSEDSDSAYGPNPFRCTSVTNGKTTEGSTILSNLDGLKLLDQSDISYEIKILRFHIHHHDIAWYSIGYSYIYILNSF